MRIVDENSLKGICVSDVSVISGIRTAGRMADYRKMPRHKHGIFYIWNGGAAFWQTDGKSVTATAGTLVFLPKGQRYKMQYTAGSSTFVVVNFEMFDRSTDDLALFDEITVLGEDTDSHQIANIMVKFEMCSAAQGAPAEFRRKELLFRLLRHVCEDSIPSADSQPRYSQILKGVLWLKQSYLENIPIMEFAKACNISISSFRALFRKQYGMSPLQYRNHLRINRAKELLEDGSYTVAEVAYASGFENVGYFCNSYKKITGETPTQTKRLNGVS